VPLDPDKIKEIYAKKEQKARTSRGGGPRTASGKKIDPNDRSYQAWFTLNHLMIDHDTNEMVYCDNPSCPGDKQYGQIVVEINGSKLCRHCFIGGWLLSNSNQLSINP
jgi:hypothetical protein